MLYLWTGKYAFLSSREMFQAWSKRLGRILVSVALMAVVTLIVYSCHAKAFVAGFIYLFPVMVIAFRWGFFEATIASILAVCCLDFFFTEPLFHLYMSDPQDWVALVSFEAIVLLVTRFAAQLKRHVIEVDSRREQVEKLYVMSRNALLLDRKDTIGAQLAKLIKEVFQLDGASIWDARESRLDSAGIACIVADEACSTWVHEHRQDDIMRKRFQRELFIGDRSVGAIGLAGTHNNSCLDARTADAVASLTALALEHSYSFKAESDAQASKQTEQLRSAVLDGLAHAFKTPLATIQAASSGLLAMNTLHPAQEELVTIINRQAIHLGRLTTQALQTAQVDGESLTLRKKEIPVREFLQDMAGQSRHQLNGHSVQVFSEASVVAVWADQGLLKMALWELLDNALKYATPGAPITLRAAMTDSEVVFSVTNEGSYIDPEERIRIFRRFYRSPGSRHRAAGTGVGLSFVKRIAEAHLGRVWVKSEPDIGTTFFFTLPRGRREI
jgi:two-component system sensor histidine kinase KdpD